MIQSQFRAPLVDALCSCASRQRSAFYTPGHKGGKGISKLHRTVFGDDIFRVDLPELPELDDLFAPESVILEAEHLAARAFGAEQTWFLVNGSTCGVESALLATCGPGDRVLVPRNAHQSVLSGLILSGAMPVWIAPAYDQAWQLPLGVEADEIAIALKQDPNIKAIVIVSPTYEGVCSDIKVISQIAHSYGIPLIVDAAHGPHFAFHDGLPPSALSCGADIVVHSAHKVLAAFTQAALLHVQGERCDRDRLNQSLRITQSSSPSYLLLGSLDAARHQMANWGQMLMEQTLQLAGAARQQLRNMNLPVLNVSQGGIFQQDLTRLTIDVSTMSTTGFIADTWLNERGVTVELPSFKHLTCIVSLGNSIEDIDRLIQELRHLPANGQMSIPQYISPELPKLAMSPREAFFAPTRTCVIEDAVGCLSAQTICIYPPGIPNLMPGEVITEQVLQTLNRAQKCGAHLSGLADPTLRTLRVLRH
ncbi:MAG: aminotransferase class I/II-fold pyridoxal phosphate-dependent enzyme [Leptolyngbya sp. SIO3F4]|nr:aminotransferase class I/II-fold pyridoxal phosphate-dependent enzyme [Leptolyngbya sp. SIO3F4]